MVRVDRWTRVFGLVKLFRSWEPSNKLTWQWRTPTFQKKYGRIIYIYIYMYIDRCRILKTADLPITGLNYLSVIMVGIQSFSPDHRNQIGVIRARLLKKWTCKKETPIQILLVCNGEGLITCNLKLNHSAGGHLTASSHCDYNRAEHLSELPLKYASVQRIQRKRIYHGPCSGIMSYEKRFLAGLIIILAVIGWQGLQPATLPYVPCFQHSRNDGLVQGTMFLKSIGKPISGSRI